MRNVIIFLAILACSIPAIAGKQGTVALGAKLATHYL